MLLTLDVGNSHIHAGVFAAADKLILQFRYTTASASCSSDQIGIFLRQALHENQLDPQKIQGIAIASVVPNINYSLRAAIIKYFNQQPFFLDHTCDTGLTLPVKTPDQIGADRLAACIAAVKKYPNQDLLIIDLGTATVFDIVTSEKKYLSGAIFPGIQTSLEALTNRAALLSSVPIIKPKVTIGYDTETNIQSGIYYSHLGALKELKQQMILELNRNHPVFTIATGGFAQLLNAPNLFDIVIPTLLLQGLYYAYENNQ